MDLGVGQHEQDNGVDIVSPVSPAMVAVESSAGASAPDERGPVYCVGPTYLIDLSLFSYLINRFA